MQTFNFKIPVLNSKGDPQSQLLSDLFSDMLMASDVKPPIAQKYFLWALELAKSGQLSLDTVDVDTLQKFIDESPNLTVLGRGRLTEVLKTPAEVLVNG